MARPAKNHGLYRQKNKDGEYEGSYLLPFISPITGKRVIKTTGTDNLEEAKRRIPLIISRYVEDKKGRKATEEEAIHNAWTMKSAWDEYIKMKKVSGIASATLESYSATRNVFIRIMGSDFPIASIDRDALIRFADERMKEGKKASTYTSNIALFISVLRYAEENGKYKGNANKLLPPSLKRRIPAGKRYLSPDEYAKLMAAYSTGDKRYSHLADYVQMYTLLGLRDKELFRIRKCDINLQSGTIRITGTKTEDSDGTLPIPSPLIPMLTKLINGRNDEDRLFPGANLTHSLKTACKRANIPECTTRDLRRTTGSILASNGVPLQVIQKVLRHSNITITAKHYAKLMPQVIPETMERLAMIMG
jgi:integrase